MLEFNTNGGLECTFEDTSFIFVIFVQKLIRINNLAFDMYVSIWI